MRLSRPCYDKPWRCPGWAGGGMRYAKRERCADGRVSGWDSPARWPHLWFHRCGECGVVTLPFATRWLDPSWLAYRAQSWWRYR